MFVTLVALPASIQLTLWVGEERHLTQIWLAEEYEQKVSAPDGLAGVIGEACSWLARQGVESLRAVVWQRRGSEAAGIEDFAVGLARAMQAKSFEVPLWWEEPLPKVAGISGLPGITRKGVYDRVAHEAAIYQASLELGYLPEHFILANLDDGVTVAAYGEGRLWDVNNARDGEGPMGLVLPGSLPTELLIHWAFISGEPLPVLQKRLENGGWSAYKGKLSRAEWESIVVYHVLKEIGAMRAVLRQKGKVLILTGKTASYAEVIKEISRHVSALLVKVISEIDAALGLARIWRMEDVGGAR